MIDENDEDVSHTYVAGSIGTAGTFAVDWAPRRSPASDRARREALTVLGPVLSKFKSKTTKRAPARQE